MTSERDFDPDHRRLLEAARRATLGTIAGDGTARLIPICFALHPSAAILYTPLDEKPKRAGDPHELARVRDIGRDPRVTVLVDRWDETWSRLAWLRCHGDASLLEPGDDAGEHASAIEALRRRYEQYADHDLESRPIVRIVVVRTVTWGDL